MKLNNKGFAISSIMYLILIMAILLISIILTLLGNRKVVLDKLKENVKAEVYQDTTDLEFNRLYKRLDYIESTGTQYIDTGYSLTSNNEKVYIDYEKTSVFDYASLFGSEYTSQGTVGTRIFTLIIYGKDATSSIYAGSTNNGSITTSLNQRYQTELEAKNLKITGTHKNVYSNTTESINLSYSIANGDISNNKANIILFGNNVYNGIPGQFVSAKVYSFKLWDDGILVRNMIPCYRKSDNAVGMYDTVNGVFYTNKGTGVFIKGTESDFNRQYQELDYIQATGTQWINTDYVMSSSVLDVHSTISFQNFTNNEQAVMGIGSNFELYATNTPDLRVWGNNGTNNIYASGGTPTINTWYNLKAQYKSNILGISVNGGAMNTTTLSDLKLNANPVMVLAYRPNGAYAASAKLRMLRFYDNGVIIKNFIPCYRKSDGEIGLYDTISKQFYTNDGTGTFTKGPEVN